MKTVTMYEAEDGKQFRFQVQCVEYEQQCIDLAAANEMLINGATLFVALTRANQTRPWWDNSLTLEDKTMLMKITKDTGFVVRHWQGSGSPVYKACRIDDTGEKILLFGDVGWGNTYGNWVTLPALLRYASGTAAFVEALK